MQMLLAVTLTEATAVVAAVHIAAWQQTAELLNSGASLRMQQSIGLGSTTGGGSCRLCSPEDSHLLVAACQCSCSAVSICWAVEEPCADWDIMSPTTCPGAVLCECAETKAKWMIEHGRHCRLLSCGMLARRPSWCGVVLEVS